MPNGISRVYTETVRDYRHWMVIARELVHERFVGGYKELQGLGMQTAQGLMMDHRLGAIERNLSDIKTTLKEAN